VTPTPVLPDRDSVYTLSAMSVGATVLQIPISPGEYLLMEYREPGAGDRTPPAAGVLIYHIAESLPLYPSADAPRQYRVSLIEADDSGALLRTETEGGDRGVSEDAFGVSRSELRPGTHSGAKGIDGVLFRFLISGIILDRAAHLARVRVAPR